MPGRNSEELQQADNQAGQSPLHIEAENYLYQSGAIASESCSDDGGGQDLTNIGGGSYAVYSVTVAQAGTYLVKFRLEGSGGIFQFKDSSLNVLATVTVPNTGSGQTWQTITATVVLRAGTQQVHFYCTQPGWNLNWLEFVFRAGKSSSSSSNVVGYRYSINGQEKESELNENITTAQYWEYDSRIGRRWNTEPLEKKYPYLSPYITFGNNPVLFSDPNGKDIIILSAPKGAGGFGHAAVLIGNDKIGWTLYSKNGTFGSSGTISSGPDNNNPEAGIYVGSLSSFASSARNFHHGQVQYTSAFRIISSVEVDAPMKEAALKQVNKWYDVTGSVSGSCIDVCSDALQAGGFKTGEKGKIEGGNYPGRAQILVGTLKPMVPNERYKNIVEQNKGTDISNQIVPTEESKEKFKKENDDAEAVKKIKEENKPSMLDKVGNWWNGVKSSVSQGIKDAVNKLSTPH